MKKRGKYRAKKVTSPARGKCLNSAKTKPKSSRPESNGPELPLRKKIFYALICTILLPSILITIVEISLRFSDYGFNPSAVQKLDINGKKFIGDNKLFSQLFFPPVLSRAFEPFVFTETKRPETYRIFVLGASACQGVPDGAYSFSRILNEMLRYAYPGFNFEVINTGMTAINSHAVLEIARDLSKYQPDLFIVYLGNNEVVGPYGAGTVFSPQKKNRLIIRAGIMMRHLRLAQWFSSIAAKKHPVISEWGGMSMYLDSQVHADDRRMDIVYKHFRKNLADICQTADDSNAETILCTVGTNLRDCAPFASLHKKDLPGNDRNRWDRHYEEAVKFEKGGQYQKALEQYRQAEKIDTTYAEMQYRMARCMEQIGDMEDAKKHYKLALHYDTLRFRADRNINDIIRQTAGKLPENNVHLADVSRKLSQQSPDGITGNELFYEHVHMNFSGNYLTAGILFNKICGLLPSGIREKVNQPAVIPTEAQCRQNLAFTKYNEYRLLKKVLEEYISEPPFTGQAYHTQNIESRNHQLNAMQSYHSPQGLEESVSVYESAINERPDDWNLHWNYGIMLSEEILDFRKAENEFQHVIKLVPHFSKGHLALGQLLNKLNRHSDAIISLERSIKLFKDYPDPYYHLAHSYQALGRKDEAIRNYQKTLEISKTYFPAYNDLAEQFYKNDQIDEAAKVCLRGLELFPKDPKLNSNLGVIYARQGNIQMAHEQLVKALKLDPESEEIQSVYRHLFRKSPFNNSP